MKLAQFKLRFTSHCLANGRSGDTGHDVFPRDGNNCMIWQKSWFFTAFKQAIELAGIRGIKPGDINVNLLVDAPTQVYTRHYGGNRTRAHEAIMPSTVVAFEAAVDDRVTASALKNILEKLGHFIGLSPFGYNLGFGRFEVVEVNVAPSEPPAG